jgi:hypothetical protein
VFCWTSLICALCIASARSQAIGSTEAFLRGQEQRVAPVIQAFDDAKAHAITAGVVDDGVAATLSGADVRLEQDQRTEFLNVVDQAPQDRELCTFDIDLDQSDRPFERLFGEDCISSANVALETGRCLDACKRETGTAEVPGCVIGEVETSILIGQAHWHDFQWPDAGERHVAAQHCQRGGVGFEGDGSSEEPREIDGVVADVGADVQRHRAFELLFVGAKVVFEQCCEQDFFVDAADDDLVGDDITGKDCEPSRPVGGAATQDPGQQAPLEDQRDGVDRATNLDNTRRPIHDGAQQRASRRPWPH